MLFIIRFFQRNLFCKIVTFVVMLFVASLALSAAGVLVKDPITPDGTYLNVHKLSNPSVAVGSPAEKLKILHWLTDFPKDEKGIGIMSPNVIGEMIHKSEDPKYYAYQDFSLEYMKHRLCKIADPEMLKMCTDLIDAGLVLKIPEFRIAYFKHCMKGKEWAYSEICEKASGGRF